jgi:hypothetical protein
MKLFSHRGEATIGVLVDIGSASVLTAYVRSVPGTPAPEIIWSHREHIPLRGATELEQGAKNVMAALMNAAILLETTGRAVLDQAVPGHATPNHISVSVAAPWSYTVTKTISYTGDDTFKVTNELVRELERAAEQKIELELKENDAAATLGLAVVVRTTLAMIANGYIFTTAHNQDATALSLSRASGVVQEYLVAAMKNVQEKMLPSATMHLSSFMLAYQHTAKLLYPTLQEYCLVDITYEATEIGVVRDGVLQYCTHVSYGAYSLARDIATATGKTPAECYGRLSGDDFLTPDAANSATEAITEAYQKKLSDLLHETGDTLAVPKTMLLHANLETETFFAKQVKQAAEAATRSTHSVFPVSSKLLQAYYSDAAIKDLKTRHDTALLISAHFFHTAKDNPGYDWK